jgi:hypothetical protein
MNAQHTKSRHGRGVAADEDETIHASAAAIAEFGTVLVERDPDDLVGRAFAVCDAETVAQPTGVIIGRIVEPSCCIFQRLDGSLGMIPTAAFTVRALNAPRENGQVVLYRNAQEMAVLLAPPPPATPEAGAEEGAGQ